MEIPRRFQVEGLQGEPKVPIAAAMAAVHRRRRAHTVTWRRSIRGMTPMMMPGTRPRHFQVCVDLCMSTRRQSRAARCHTHPRHDRGRLATIANLALHPYPWRFLYLLTRHKMPTLPLGSTRRAPQAIAHLLMMALPGHVAKHRASCATRLRADTITVCRHAMVDATEARFRFEAVCTTKGDGDGHVLTSEIRTTSRTFLATGLSRASPRRCPVPYSACKCVRSLVAAQRNR